VEGRQHGLAAKDAAAAEVGGEGGEPVLAPGVQVGQVVGVADYQSTLGAGVQVDHQRPRCAAGQRRAQDAFQGAVGALPGVDPPPAVGGDRLAQRLEHALVASADRHDGGLAVQRLAEGHDLTAVGCHGRRAVGGSGLQRAPLPVAGGRVDGDDPLADALPGGEDQAAAVGRPPRPRPPQLRRQQRPPAPLRAFHQGEPGGEDQLAARESAVEERHPPIGPHGGVAAGARQLRCQVMGLAVAGDHQQPRSRSWLPVPIRVVLDQDLAAQILDTPDADAWRGVVQPGR
jgi:hypothetical protein